MSTRTVSVIGAGKCADNDEGKALYDTAVHLGTMLAENDYIVVCGGLGGVMEGVCKGARKLGGSTIGILPSYDRHTCNAWVKTPIATGLGQMRNMLVVANGDVIIAVGGGYGTLSEVALAKKTGKHVIAIGAMTQVDGVEAAQSAAHAVELVNRFFEQVP